MAVRIDAVLTDNQIKEMKAIPPNSWFTQFIFTNMKSPDHPKKSLAINNKMKQDMVNDWISKYVKGKRVLDLFSANGGFSIIAALSGAKTVVGLEFSKERIECAEFVTRIINPTLDCEIVFTHGDVYCLKDYFKEPFDVVLCLGGLYHVADPAYILRQIRSVTKERLIVQTSQVLPRKGNWARFVVRTKDKTADGLTSIRERYGTWHYSIDCIRELLLHGGFKVIEERIPPKKKRNRFPWYIANCEIL
jgi:tRNA (mo5U34)-methyltransferase